ncbi:Dual specificity protein phosphatase [Gryllus bimaculatus]|nr:Dual specificity protein phosphatase [Gryllus bimaculatus]
MGGRRLIRRRSSSQRTTPPSSPRTLPPTPTSTRRPRSGPAGLHYYTASAPPSRSSSRLDMTSLGVPGIGLSMCTAGGGGLSAPTSPRSSPPVSPQHWPRRASTLSKRPLS